MSIEPVQRPASVSFVVILTWIVAILTLVGGVLLLLASNASLVEAGVNPSTARTQGWIGVVLGLVIALFASALGKGSGFARIMISLLMMIRFVVALFAMVVLWGTGHFIGLVVTAAFALLILALLWNSKAAAFFASR